jgi:trk system potassium uptake protein
VTRSLYIVIAGCGRLGSLLANELSLQGHSVVVIDPEETAFYQLAANFGGFQIVGDAVELEVLHTAKMERADCFLATTDYDNVNLMLAQVARTIFGVPLVVARIFDPSRKDVYQKLGVETISPTELSAQVFLQAIQASTGRV